MTKSNDAAARRRTTTGDDLGPSAPSRTKTLWSSVLVVARKDDISATSTAVFRSLASKAMIDIKVGGFHSPDEHDACGARAGGSETRCRLHWQHLMWERWMSSCSKNKEKKRKKEKRKKKAHMVALVPCGSVDVI